MPPSPNQTSSITPAIPTPDTILAIYSIRILGVWELITCLIGTPLNLFALYLTIHLIRTYQANNNRWFILSMSSADLLFTTTHAPISFARYFLRYTLDAYWCRVLFIATHTSTVASSLSLLWLNCDKFVYMNKPLHYHSIVTRSRAIGLSMIAWWISLAWSVLFVFGPFNTWMPRCQVRTTDDLWLYIVFAVCFFVGPTLVSLVISVYVATVALHARNRDSYERKVNRRANDPNWIRSSRASRWRTITFVFTTTVWSACTCLPYRFAYIALTLDVYPTNRGAYVAAYFALLGMLATNAVGNPVITIMTQSLYRMKVWQLFGFGRPRRRGGSGRDEDRMDRMMGGGNATDWSSSYSSISVMQAIKI